MLLIVLGALLVVAGMVVATMSTAKRGRLSQSKQPGSDVPRDTLEPTGKGRRLGLKADLPGLALVGLGILLIVAGSAT